MLPAGTTIAHFVIERLLGEGGMGAVYLAQDEQLGRQVALKLLSLEEESEQLGARFEREARAAAAINHPNVATIYAVGKADGFAYIAQEYVRGQTLSDYARAERRPLPHLLEICGHLAKAVSAAHMMGIVHRDLKPENVMISEVGVVKVLDFGIAKKLEAQATLGEIDGEALTVAGAVMGTPGYMSPEQAQGQPVDQASDVFSFGAIVYELVTGRHAFQGKSGYEILSATLHQDPPPASSHDRSLPQRLDELLGECLTKDPSRRPRDLVAIAGRLDEIASEQARTERAVDAYSDTVLDGVEGPGASTEKSMTPAVRTTGGVAVTQKSPEVSETLPVRRSFLPYVLGALALGGAALSFVVLSEKGESGAVEGAPAEPTASSEVLKEPRLGLRTLEQYVAPTRESSSVRQSLPVWRSAILDFETAVEQEGAPMRWQAALHFCRAQLHYLSGELDAATKEIEQARSFDEKWELPWILSSATLVKKREYEGAQAAAQRAQVLTPDSWAAVAAAASAYAAADDFSSAIEEYQRALRLAPESPVVKSGLALAYHAARMDAEALRTAQKAIDLDPDLVGVRVLLAERALEEKKYQESFDHASRAVGVAPRDLSALLIKGDALLALGKNQEAVDVLAEAVRIWKTEKQAGAPEVRLREIEAALDAKKIPPLRHPEVTSVASGPVVPRTKDSSRSTMRTSVPRSKPSPSPAPPPRSSRTNDMIGSSF